jgi:hypothetical protein
MPVYNAGDAILRHSALRQRQKPDNPKRAREDSGARDGDSLSYLESMGHAGSSSRTVLTNFSRFREEPLPLAQHAQLGGPDCV